MTISTPTRLDEHLEQPPGPDPNFNPDTVPPFPVITVEVNHEGVLSVEGARRPRNSPNPVEDAIRAAGQTVRQRGLKHCRVAGILDGRRWLFIVDEHGNSYELHDTPTKPRAPKKAGATSAQRKILILGSFALLCVLLLGGTIFGVRYMLGGGAEPPPSGPVIPQPTELPVLAPAGWSTHADWAIEIYDTRPVQIVPDAAGNLVTLIDDRTLTAVNPATGVEQWRAVLPARYSGGPWLTTIDNQPVIAVTVADALVWWPTQGAATPTTMPLPAEADISFAGTTPLITLPDQQAQIPAAAGPLNRVIPAGATAIRADGATITAINPAGQLWQLATDQPHTPEPTTQIPKPDKTPAPAEASMIGTAAGIMLIQFDAPNFSVTALYSADGTKLLTTISGARPGRDWLHNSTIAATGNLIINLETAAVTVVPEDNQWSPERVIGATVYGTRNNTPTAITTTGTITTSPSDSAEPVAIDTTHAWVIHTDSNQTTRLYALPRA